MIFSSKSDLAESPFTPEQLVVAKPWIFGIFASMFAGILSCVVCLALLYLMPHVITLRIMIIWIFVTSVGVRLGAFICNEKLFQIAGSSDGPTRRQRIVSLLISIAQHVGFFCLLWYGYGMTVSGK
ncbi:MAG: hypothetical protein JW384_03969 [Nitrosomonadaceae bacterium]|nr:hypothetical protein [Nitrosomonadaceae bacterium]